MENLSGSDDLPDPRQRKRKYRLGRLALKELRETLRDRRTIITLILMPLLVYPVLSLVFRTFLATNAGLFANDDGPIVLRIAYHGEMNHELTDRMLGSIGNVIALAEQERVEAATAPKNILPEGDNAEKKPPPDAADNDSADNDSADNDSADNDSADDDSLYAGFKSHKWSYWPPTDGDRRALQKIVEDGDVDLGLFFETDGLEQWEVGRIKLISRNDEFSKLAARQIQNDIDLFNDHMLRRMLIKRGMPTEPALTVIQQHVESPPEESVNEGGFSLASLVPLILVLMTITGAVYPAIDLTAGEKERGTLETLMAAPVPRFGILLSKFVAVMTVAVLTALLNMIGMGATIWAFQLDQFLGGTHDFSLTVVVQIFLLLVLFAAFFSALLLAVTSYARSFKEAQSYLIPIIIMAMGPGLMAMTPGLQLAGPWAITPMVNILLLARDVIQHQVEWIPAGIAIVSTLFYAVIALMIAARIFGSDSILYASHGSFGEMFARPRNRSRFVPLAAAIICLTALFPINFLSIGFLARMPSGTPGDLSVRFMVMGVFTILAFLIFPWIIAWHQRTRIVSAFGLRSARPIFYVAALLLGVSLWPIVMSLIAEWHDLYTLLAGSEKGNAWHDRLVEETAAQIARVRLVSPWLIGLCLAVIPAVCEEWFFRGMLLRTLLDSKKVATAIFASAIFFGLFHVLSNTVIALDRLLPSTLVGIVLGFLAYKSNSIWPGVLLHALHNSAVSFLAYYQPQLSKLPWFPGESEDAPLIWVAIAAGIASIGCLLVVVAKRTKEPPNDRPKE